MASNLSSIVELIFGLFAGVLIAWFTIKVQKKRRRIQYHVSSIPLLAFNPASGRTLEVTVQGTKPIKDIHNINRKKENKGHP